MSGLLQEYIYFCVVRSRRVINRSETKRTRNVNRKKNKETGRIQNQRQINQRIEMKKSAWCSKFEDGRESKC